MKVPVQSLLFADPREAADLAAFLGRLLHYDRAAAVRLQAGGGDALAVFGRPPSFEVLAIRTARLARPETLDLTVSAGELLESLDISVEGPGDASGERCGALPAPVTGPPWTGVLPPRGPWREQAGLPGPDALRASSTRPSPNSVRGTRHCPKSSAPAPSATVSAGRSGPGPSAPPSCRCARSTPPSPSASCAPTPASPSRCSPPAAG